MVLRRVRIGQFTFAFHFAKTLRTVGVLSRREDGSHFLLWEFDEGSLSEIKKALVKVQDRYRLPDIFIASSGGGSHYHAYCFKPVSWRDLVRILADTDLIDLRFLRWTLYRGHATLRIGEKAGRTIHWIAKLKGHRRYTVPKGGWKFVEYETVWPGWG